jgi:hypothetical protein
LITEGNAVVVKSFEGVEKASLLEKSLAKENFRLLSWFIRVPSEKFERVRLLKFSLTEDYCEGTLFRYDLRVES